MDVQLPATQGLQVLRHRGGLKRTLKTLRRGKITIGFCGGSITDPRAQNWPEPVTSWFVERYPKVRVTVENAAIGATGSDLCVFRAERDLLAPDCDLVFVEYAVNDGTISKEQRARSREGLLRKLLAGKGRDVVLVYTYNQDMYADMMAGRVPVLVAEFEELAEHYGIGSVWMGLWALREVLAGHMRSETWLPDGLHPQARGSYSYAQSVMAFLEKELGTKPSRKSIKGGDRLPVARNPRNWEGAFQLPFSEVQTTGPWAIHRWPHCPWIDHVLATAAPGARLAFEFKGRAVSLGFDFGKLSSDFRYRLDGGAWKDVTRDRPDWCGDLGWFRIANLVDDLKPGKHHMEIEVTHPGTGCFGANFRLAFVGIVP